MATLEEVYSEVGRMSKLATEAQDVNYCSDADLGDQAERLAEIAALATSASKTCAAVNKALGG